MKITKISKEENSIYIEVDVLPKYSFMFDLKDIVDKEDLIVKLKYAVKCELLAREQQETNDTKFEELNTLVNTEIQ